MNWKQKKSSSNPKLKSTIVHKPFSTGTVNFFHPHRPKSNSQLSTDEPLDTKLDSTEQSSLDSNSNDRWLDSLTNPWSLSAIAIIFLANLISGAVIWRNYRLSAKVVEESEPILSNIDLTATEFIPLNLNTLSMLDTVEDTVSEPELVPIVPAQAPLDNLAASEYHYVLTEYSGDRSLALSRQKVKQVALVNLPQGMFIYLGAFETKEQADRFVALLSKDNFIAKVYPFD